MASEHDILQELKDLNSSLGELPRAMPYELPAGYFEGFAAAITVKVSARHELMNKDVPFTVPHGYFDNLPGQILQSVQEPAAQKTRSIWLNLRWAAAAVLVLAIGLGSYRVLNPATLSIEQQLSAIPNAELLAYVHDNIDEFETDIIISNMNNVHLINPQTGNINNNAIEDYLEEEGWQ